MLNRLWPYFPAFYAVPFLLATSRFEHFSTVATLVRWIALLMGCAFAFQRGLSRAGVRPGILTRIDFVLLAFLTLFFASSTWSIQPPYTFMRSASMAMLYGCVMWGLWDWADCYSELKMFRQILLSIGVIMAANLVIGGALYPSELMQARFQGLFYNPNNIGLVISIAFPLAVVCWLATNEREFILVALLLFANLLACGMRSSLLGCFVSCTLLACVFFRQRSNLVIALAAVVGGVGSYASTTDLFQKRIIRESTLETASNRTFFWDLAKQYIANRPLTGHGFGTDTIVHEHYGVVLRELGLKGDGVMSSYYGFAVCMGWPATYVAMGLFGGLIVACLSRFRRDPASASYCAILASGLIVCIFEGSIYSAGNCFSFQFWLVFAMLMRHLYYRKLWAIGSTVATENQQQHAARLRVLNS